MWPGPYTFSYLIFGLTPICLLAWSIIRNGTSELLSLRVVTLVLLWIGYQFSPWIAYLQGLRWSSFLLSPRYLDTALMFSTLSMFALLLGYSLVFRPRDAHYRRRLSVEWTIPVIRWHWIVVVGIAVLALTIFTRGGFSEFWEASYSRGTGQWVEKTWDVRFRRTLNVLVAPAVVLLTLMSGAHILRNPRSFSRLLLGGFGIAIACLPAMHAFSRMSGFPLLLVAYLIIRFRKPRIGAIFICTALVLFAFFLGSVGMRERGQINPGIANYAHAVFSGGEVASRSNSLKRALDPNSNMLDAVAPFTRRVESREVSGETPGLNFIDEFLLNISPVPSGLIEPREIGIGLSTYMGTSGSTGLTSPALADVYYAFGYGGLVVLVILGSVLGWLDRYAVYSPGMVSNLAVLLAVIGTAISLHNGIRAWTRLLLYAGIMIFLVRYIGATRRDTKLLIATSHPKL